jgi:hypothetical protein
MDQISQFFSYTHLDPAKAEISKLFFDLNAELVERLKPSPERTTAQRKLLEAKDCAVRAQFGVFTPPTR